jgi:hypothetical protein
MSCITKFIGATNAANAGVSNRLLKKHGRWKTDKAKDGYVREDLKYLLSVSIANLTKNDFFFMTYTSTINII